VTTNDSTKTDQRPAHRRRGWGPSGVLLVLAGFVLARASAGLADSTIRNDVGHLEQMRTWFGRPLWEAEPADADAYFGRVMRDAAKGTRLARAQSLKTYFLFLELRHKVELHQMTGRVVECPIDEMNRPRGGAEGKLRVPPSKAEIGQLFAGWREERGTIRKFAPAARNFAVSRLMAQIGLRVNETRQLDLHDIKWDLGRFGKVHVRYGKGNGARARGSGSCHWSPGPEERCAGSSRTCPRRNRSAG
jgi:integrase